VHLRVRRHAATKNDRTTKNDEERMLGAELLVALSVG
jgi:hypothetical protein